LQGMLWRLDNDRPGPAAAAAAAAGVEIEIEATEMNADGEDGAAGATHGQKLGERSGDARSRNSRSRSPSALESSKLNIVFDEKLGREKRRGKLVRYQINPRENWGPMNRAGRTG